MTWTIRSTSAANVTTLFAAIGQPLFGDLTNNGVWKSTDGGNTWAVQTTSGLPSGATVGRVNLDICKTNGSIVYAAFGTASSGLLQSVWKTTNGGTSWTNTTNGADPGGQTYYTLLVRVSPTDPNTVYLGTVDLLKSTNGGTSWAVAAGQSLPTYPGNHPDMYALAFDPTNSNHLYVGHDGGLLYSSDATAKWQLKNTGRGTMEFYGLDVHPTDPNALLAGAQDNGIQHRSNSNTYTRPEGGDGTNVAYNYADPSKVVGSNQQSYSGNSSDGGVTFNPTETFGNPNNDRVAFAAPLVNDHATPASASHFYIGTSQVYRSDSTGANFVSVSPNLATVSHLNVIAVAPSNPNVLYTGSNNGIVYYCANVSAASPVWTKVSTGLTSAAVGGIAVDPTNPAIVYVSFLGYGHPHIYKSVNSGTSWTDITGSLPNTSVSSLVVNPTDSTTLFAATDTGVFVTSNGGTTWANYGSGLPTTFCTMLRANATTGYLTVSTFGRGIWRISLNGNSNPVPTLTSLSPNTKTAGSGVFTLTVNGTNFINGSAVRWNGSNRTTAYVSATQLTAAIPASDVASVGTANVTVFTGTPGGGTSNALTFSITAPNNPVPTLTSISPSTKPANSGAFTLTVNGTNFINGSAVRWNGSARTTTYVSATQLTAAIPASDIATIGAANVSVFNPTPGGGTSNTLTFSITTPSNPVPTLTSLSPGSATAGGAAFTLTVNGTGFVGGSAVLWNGSARTTTYVSATQLTAAIPAADIATAGTASVAVFTGAPGGGTSNALTFSITIPAPAGDGLYAQYYTPDDATFNFAGKTPFLQTVDPTVNFQFNSLPLSFNPQAWDTGVPPNSYTTRWTGKVYAPVTGNYVFTTISDDGSVLTINGVKVVDNNHPQAPTAVSSAPVALVAGQYYTIEMDYYQAGGGGSAQLAWAYPGQVQQIIPQADLFSQQPSGAWVSGTLAFDSIVSTAAAQNVLFTFRPTDGSAAFTQTQQVPASGTFTLNGLPAKNYTLHIKGDRNLAVNVPVNTSSSNVTGVMAFLPGGDATNDNVVDIADFGLLVNAYNSSSAIAGSGYDIRADFTGDGVVDIGDFGVLVNNYNQSGAP